MVNDMLPAAILLVLIYHGATKPLARNSCRSAVAAEADF